MAQINFVSEHLDEQETRTVTSTAFRVSYNEILNGDDEVVAKIDPSLNLWVTPDGLEWTDVLLVSA